MKNIPWKYAILVLLGMVHLSIHAPADYNDRYHIYRSSLPVDAQLELLSIEEKVGQLFMLPVYTNDSNSLYQTLEAIKRYHIGGIIFMKGHPKTQAHWTRIFQKASKTPLMVAMDAEWGAAMRLDSVLAFPRQMTLGAADNDSLVYAYGRAIGQQLKSLGVNVSFAPVADLNTNPQNPVINIRSFGSNKYAVAQKVNHYIAGLQDEGILAVAKHFPGHGDTYVDSHEDLPTIKQKKRSLFRQELYPFRRAFKAGVGGVMSAHIHVRAYHKFGKTPASLSSRITSKLLRRQLGFEGLCFSDALNMGAITKNYAGDEVDVMAFNAGNDVLLFPQNIEKAHATLVKQAKANEEVRSTVRQSVTRILQAKYWTPNEVPLQADKLMGEVNKPAFEALNQEIAESAISLLQNEENLLPLQFEDRLDTVVCVTNDQRTRPFARALGQYCQVKYVVFNDRLNQKALIQRVREQALPVIIANYVPNNFAFSMQFKLQEKYLSFLRSLQDKRAPVLVHLGTPYALDLMGENAAVLQCYESLPAFQRVAAQMVVGALVPHGKLPVHISDKYSYKKGMTFDKQGLLTIGVPEQVGLSSTALYRIDSIVQKGLQAGATPGCQVLVAKSGRVIYQKAFGYHTYDSSRMVENGDLYDVASVTKILASTALLMKMYDAGYLHVDSTLGAYLGEEVDSPKSDLKIREVLAHQSGLAAWIPFYKLTLTENGYCDSNYCYTPNDWFSVQVADSLYVNRNIVDTIYKTINTSEMGERGRYRYSDLGYFYMKKIIERHYGTPLDQAIIQQFYLPLGIGARYNPLSVYPLEQIVPTERDDYFRHKLIHGYVHDPAAAMIGGVGGHAGVFANSWDIAVYMQMLLNGGEYGNQSLLAASTIDTFIKKQFSGNRKGMGFDKPEMDRAKGTPAIRDMSAAAFGHTGFTGTCVWSDPAHDITYVFLSNRVHPTAENKKLVYMNIRTDILQVIYDDILSKTP